MSDKHTRDGPGDGPFDTDRRSVLKLLGTGAGLGLAGFTTGAATVGSVSGAGAAGSPGVSPKDVSLNLQPGESATIEKAVTTPEIPPKADIFLLEDESGSFYDDIDELQAQAPDIWDAIAATGTDFTMGAGGFRDFDNYPWGFASIDEWVYRRVQDLTMDKSTFTAGVNTLTANGGGDGAESYLDALHYIADASHPAIDSNQDGDTSDAVDTPTGQQPSWRAGSTRIVLLATDADCHERTDSSGSYPGDVTISETVSALNAAGITVIGLTPNGAGGISCVDQLASGTGGSVHKTTTGGDTIGDAILAGLKALPATVTPTATCDGGLSITFDPASQTVTSGETATFDETITVDGSLPPGEQTLSCTVDWLINGEPAGDAFVQTVTVEVCTPTTVDLIAGQNEVVGTVTVTENGDDILVTYSLDDGWYMSESHLHLAADCADIPQTRSGNPKVGRFDYSRTYDPAVQTDTYVVDQAAHGFVDGDTLCIAAHAVVFMDADGDGEPDKGGKTETAWGEGDRFTERGNWAMHFAAPVCD